MPKILVIPDVHEKIYRAEKIIEKYPDVIKRIWLGDYFDSFEYVKFPQHWETTALWLREQYNDPKNIMLMGNHDVHYAIGPLAGCDRYYCSGYMDEKQKSIQKTIGVDWYQNLKWIHTETIAGKKFLFTHAGLHPTLIPPFANFEDLNDKIAKNFANGVADEFLMAGYARGGRQNFGGITWLDWHKEFLPVEGICQIVGHTTVKSAEWKEGNICIDTKLNGVLLLDTETGIPKIEVV